MEPQDYTRLTQKKKNIKWLYKNLTGKIIGAAMEVHREMGCVFLEYVYEEALCYELKIRNISFERQKNIDIQYKDIIIPKKYMADILIEDKVVVEIRATKALNEINEAQLLNYLKATKMRVGLLFNFGTKSLETKRKIL